MATVTVNISFKNDLLAEIDRTASQESRSRSELLREAARVYIGRKKRWDQLFGLAESRRCDSTVSESDVLNEIQAYRRKKKAAQ